DRLPPRDDSTSPGTQAAEAAIKTAEAAVRAAAAKVAGINAEVEAQEAQIKFLTGVKMNDAVASAEALSSVSQMIGTEVLTARLAALAAQGGLAVAEEAVTQAQEALDAANDARAALSQGDEDYVALSVAVTAKGGEGHLTVTHYVGEASWRPVYDLALDRKAGKIAVERGVLVSQYSGEDWAGVALTLSTARPAEQAAPSILYPQLRSIVDPAAEADMAARAGSAEDGLLEPAPVVAASVGMTAEVAYEGGTVVYHYPAAVSIATEVEDLRLALDTMTFSATVQARAVPRYDKTAFVMANMVNDSPEILLPGTAYLYRDGALVGGVTLEALSPGGDVDLGFGAIDGIRLKRDMPQRAEGDRGILTTSTQIEEKAVLEVENLTGEAWPVRLMDQVPYSEQEDLKISYTADPAVTEADIDGKRGVLAWEFDLAPGETQKISLQSVISWPEGKVLQ
ncbi:MAG: DUF4139 domain-containing protein, partial [Candidatus Saccharibacteria bacterium]|nr:DUF4139 domain-containing protein [Pseudorhodobacter sp.]